MKRKNMGAGYKGLRFNSSGPNSEHNVGRQWIGKSVWWCWLYAVHLETVTVCFSPCSCPIYSILYSILCSILYSLSIVVSSPVGKKKRKSKRKEKKEKEEKESRFPWSALPVPIRTSAAHRICGCLYDHQSEAIHQSQPGSVERIARCGELALALLPWLVWLTTYYHHFMNIIIEVLLWLF